MGKKSLAALLCATMAMTACMLPATAAMADEPLKIEFFQQKGEEGPQKGYKEIIDKFNKENSDIEIEMNTVPDAGTVLTSRISSGDIPVIFSDFPTQTQFKQKVANGYVQDLSDQDFLKNVNESALEMTKQEDGGYYAAVYSDGPTKEWCLSVDPLGFIDKVHIGGKSCWYMLGHTFWDKTFSRRFINILNRNYDLPDMAEKLWEEIYIEHLDELKLKIRKYPAKTIFEFDSLDELRQFDSSYINHTGSSIMASIAEKMKVQEGEIIDINNIKGKDNQAVGFTFKVHERTYQYLYGKSDIVSLK